MTDHPLRTSRSELIVPGRSGDTLQASARLVGERRADRPLRQWLVDWNPWHVLILFAACILGTGVLYDSVPTIWSGGAGLAFAAVGIIERMGRR